MDKSCICDAKQKALNKIKLKIKKTLDHIVSAPTGN